ncbi:MULTISPECIES: hypothetical protein [Streptomyces]
MTRTPKYLLATVGIATGLTLAAPAANAVTTPQVTQPAAAQAANTGQAAPGSVTAMGTAPACVERFVNKPAHEAVVGNGCGVTMKLKVIVNNGYDSRCTTLRHGQHFSHWWPTGSYARTVTC